MAAPAQKTINLAMEDIARYYNGPLCPKTIQPFSPLPWSATNNDGPKLRPRLTKFSAGSKDGPPPWLPISDRAPLRRPCGLNASANAVLARRDADTSSKRSGGVGLPRRQRRKPPSKTAIRGSSSSQAPPGSQTRMGSLALAPGTVAGTRRRRASRRASGNLAGTRGAALQR